MKRLFQFILLITILLTVVICGCGSSDTSVQLILNTAQPQIKISKWHGECEFTAKHQLLGTSTANLYPVKGGYEFDITLNEKPASNKITFSIETKGLNFYYQSSLTEAEKKAGCNRPDNVVGSYAVYHATKKDDYSKMGGENYGCGKAFHIYRPQAEDAKGNRVWSELTIDPKTGTLVVTIPQDFLDHATYPISRVAGLTFGVDPAGHGASTFDVIGPGLHYYKSPSTPANNGTLTSISIYAAVWFGSPVFNPALYADGLGTSSRLAYIDSGGAAIGAANYYASTISYADLVANTQYWFGMGFSSGDAVHVYYDDSGQAGATENVATTWPATPSFNWSEGRLPSIYGTYTPSIAAPTVTTSAPTVIALTTATGHGNVTATGGATVTAWGICVSTSSNPTTADTVFAGDGTGQGGAFIAAITGLNQSTGYHARAYATNSIGTSYGADVAFRTGPNIYYVDNTQTYATGTVTNGPFTNSESIYQATSKCKAIVVGTPSTQPFTITAIDGGTPDNSHTWTGLTSGATFVPSSSPVANGSDSNTGLSSSVPWASLAKVNAQSGLTPYDSVLFKCGSAWIASPGIEFPASGTALSSITVGAYGTGTDPKILGAVLRTGADWTKTDGYNYVYEAPLAAATYSDLTGTWTPPGGSTTMGVVWYNAAGDYMWGTTQGGTGITSLALLDANAGCCYWNGDKIYIHAAAHSDPTSDGVKYWVGISRYTINTGAPGVVQDYINFSNIDDWYLTDLGFSTTSTDNAHCSSYVSLASCNTFYSVGDAFCLAGINNTATNSVSNYVKFMGAQISGQSGQTTTGCKFINYTYANTTLSSVNPMWPVAGVFPQAIAIQVGGTISDNSWINSTISGDTNTTIACGHSGALVSGAYITGTINAMIIQDGSSNTIYEGITNTTPVSNFNSGYCLSFGGGGVTLRKSNIKIASGSNGPILITPSGITNIYNNIFSGGGDSTGLYILTPGTSNTYVYNNNVYNFGTGMGWETDASGSGSIIVKNNIFHTCGKLFNPPAAITKLTSNYNCGYNYTTWDDSRSLIDWRTYSGQDANSLGPVNPQFVNPGTDFHLKSHSPCLTKGVAVGLVSDHEGKAVPQDNAYDIGAYIQNRSGYWFGF